MCRGKHRGCSSKKCGCGNSHNNLPRDVYINESNFNIGAQNRGWGCVQQDMVRSAFRCYDRNNSGYLSFNDANRAYGYIDRLYR